MTEHIKINIMDAPRFTMPDGETCYGDSDGETLYDPKKDIVYVCLCPNCQKFVKSNDKICKSCGASLVKK